jgi:hypothetical protein
VTIPYFLRQEQGPRTQPRRQSPLIPRYSRQLELSGISMRFLETLACKMWFNLKKTRRVEVGNMILKKEYNTSTDLYATTKIIYNTQSICLRTVHSPSVYATSTPPTLTLTRMGNGDIPVAFVMRGTAVRPFSDDVCTSIVCTALVSVAARVVRNCCRSGPRSDKLTTTRNHTHRGQT